MNSFVTAFSSPSFNPTIPPSAEKFYGQKNDQLQPQVFGAKKFNSSSDK
jgi:hypothetical protein